MAATAESVVERSVQLTERLLVEVERRCKNIENVTNAELQVLSGLLSKLERALATVVKEQRALNRESRAAAGDMTRAEKVNLLVDVFPTLMPDERQQLLAQLKRAHASAGGSRKHA